MWATLYLCWKMRGGNAKSVEVGLCAGHVLLMLEVEKRECCTNSEQGILCLHWKSKGGNVIPSPNCMAVKLCVDGLRVEAPPRVQMKSHKEGLLSPTLSHRNVQTPVGCSWIPFTNLPLLSS